MRIVFTTSALDKVFGGPPNAIVGASSGLASRGHSVSVIIFGQTDISEMQNQELFNVLRLNNVEVIRLKSLKTRIRGGIPNLRDLSQISKMIKSADFVSVHGVYYYQNPIIAYICKRNDIPFSSMPHGALTIYQRKQKSFKKIILGGIFEKYVLDRAASIFTASDVEKGELPSKLIKKGRVVGLGIYPRTSPQKVVKKSQEIFSFLYLGRITKKKRLDLLIKAVALLKSKTSTPFKLVVCGTGSEKLMETSKKLATNLNVDKIIEFRGWVSGEEKSLIMDDSHCFILTSNDENFGIAIPESLSHGLPCILTSKVATSKVVSDFKAGIVIDSLEPGSISDAMLEMINFDMLDKLSLAAVEASKEFYWDKVVTRWEKKIISNKD